MAIGCFLLCLHTHMPYVLSHGKSPHGTDWLYEAAAECYLPLLHALDRLKNEGIRASLDGEYDPDPRRTA